MFHDVLASFAGRWDIKDKSIIYLPRQDCGESVKNKALGGITWAYRGKCSSGRLR